MPESRRELRRRQIVSAARRLVAKDGLEALTIAALEQRLSYTRGVITYHFKDKEELVYAVLESAAREIGRATQSGVSRSQTAAGRVEAALRGMVQGFLKNREATQVLLSFWSRLGHDRKSRRLNARLYAGYRLQSARLIKEGRESGQLHDVPPAAAAAILVGLSLGIVAQAIFQPGEFDVEAALEEGAKTLRARLLKHP